MRLLLCLFWFFAVCIFPAPAFSFPSVNKKVLNNGLTVLVQSMPASEIVSIYAYVKTGSATEGPFLGSGISHFVEHMLFKGTAKRPVGAIAKEVKALGGEINASTTLDYTIYTLDLPKDKFSQGLDIISDMLMHSSFDPGEVAREREVIHGEMRLYKDRPDRRLSEDVFKNVYIRHPYRVPTIGYKNLFDAITRDQLYDYYRREYVPNNIVLSIAGGVDPNQVQEAVQEAFKDFQRGLVPQRSYEPEPAQVTPRHLEDSYPTPLWRFSFAYPGVSLTDPDLFALDVLSMALGRGESSRFYSEIYRDKHLVKEITCDNYTPQDRGLFEIEGITDKNNVPQIHEAVSDIIANVEERGLSEEELAKTKRQVLSQFVFANQTSSALAYQAAEDEAQTGDAQFFQHYVQSVKRVTNEDIKRVAAKYLNENRIDVTVLRPARKVARQQKPQPQPAAAPITKVVLKNGLTLLLKEDHSAGIVGIYATANAGVRQETAEDNGISQLFSQVWVDATNKRNDTQIAKEMDDRGGSLQAVAGRNSVAIAMDVLSEDADFAVHLLSEFLTQPAFTDKDIDQEKERMLVALDERDDNIRQYTAHQLMQTLFLVHPYRLDVLGSRQSVKRLGRKDLLEYYHRYVRPNNMVISVFGDFDKDRLKVELERQLSGLKAAPVPLKDNHEAAPSQTRTRQIKMNKEQAAVMVGFQAPGLKDQNRWPMHTLDAILGSGLSGRLFVSVRDQLGKAYTVGSEYIPGIDSGMIVFFVLTTPDKVDTVKAILRQQFARIRQQPVDLAELAAAKAYLKGSFKMSLATASDLGTDAALNELYGLGYNFYQQFDSKIDAVTQEAVQKAAQEYLDFNKAAVVVTNGP